jgi:two-component system sensor kinase FixL
MNMKQTVPSLRSKLQRIILLPTLVVMLMLLGVILFGANLIRKEIIERQQLIVHGIARQGTQYLEETGKLMRSMAYAMIQFSHGQQQELLAWICDNYPRFNALYLVDSTGRVVVEHANVVKLLGFDMSEERFFRDGRDAEALYFSEPFISVTTNQITVTMAVPIIIADRFHGMLAGELNLSLLQHMIDQVGEGHTDRAFITDHWGKLIAYPDQTWVQEQRNLRNLPLVQAGLKGQETFALFYDRDLQEWLVGRATPMTWDWIVVTTQPVRVAARSLILLVLISLVAYSVSLVVFLWAQVRNLRQIIQPITLLTQKADRLANEEYDERVPETQGAFAEIISLSQSFMHMAEAVAERTAALKIANEALKNELQERQRIEEALRESEEFLHNIIENIPNMIFVKDAKHLRFVRFNKAGEALLGYARQELIGKNDYDFFPKHEADLFANNDRVVLDHKILLDIPEEPIQTRDHGERILHTKKIPILDQEGNPLYLVGISEDVTERKQAEEEIRKLNAELEERVHQRTAELQVVNQELQSFAYVVSHDLKAPLRGISQLADWLVTDYAAVFDEQGKELVALLLGRVKRMDNLIEGILQYSRIGRVRGESVAIDLNPLLQEVIDSLALPAHVHILVADALPTIVGDRTRIQQVFQNLIGNAVKFLDKPEGQITIGGRADGTHWTFSVADNGPGIDSKYHEKIFQIFQTLASRDERESTGIGLAIVKKIVEELYQGKIWVESEIGKGSTFWFTLPK